MLVGFLYGFVKFKNEFLYKKSNLKFLYSIDMEFGTYFL